MSYLRFVKYLVEGRKTPVTRVTNIDGVNLGTIEFYPQWRKFVFKPLNLVLFDQSCLDEISQVVRTETEIYKKKTR